MSAEIQKYLTPDYCYSCAYFRKMRGHFGICNAGGAFGRFDGTKKGSACSGWRINNDLAPVIELLNKPKSDPIEQARKTFNEKAKRKRLHLVPRTVATTMYYTRANKPEKHLVGVPGARTTELRRKHGFYQHQKHMTLIKFALRALSKGKSTRQVARSIKEIFGARVSHTTVCHWGNRFLDNPFTTYHRKVGEARARKFQIREERELKSWARRHFVFRSIAEPRPVFALCPRCHSPKIVKNGMRHNKRSDNAQRYTCRACNKKFMDKPKGYANKKMPKAIVDYILKMTAQGISARRIAKNILREFDFKISHASVIRMARSFNPEVKFPVGRPHDPVWRMKLRIAASNRRNKVAMPVVCK